MTDFMERGRRHCYTSLMAREVWARLAQPFPPHALAWFVVELGPERQSARLEPYVPARLLKDRLDEAAGVENWENRFRPVGVDAMICELSVAGVTKSAVARSGRSDFDATILADVALAKAAALFGVQPPADPYEAYWVDYDTEAEEPLFLPEPATEVTQALREPSTLDISAAPLGQEDPETVRPEGQQVIERLVDRLKAEGLGHEAARLVVSFGGFGRTTEEARDLYKRLRELLLEKGAAAP